MRIGLITGEYPPMRGGIATQTSILAGNLANAGHAVHVLTDQDGRDEQVGVVLRPVVKRWRMGVVLQIHQWAADNKLDILNIHYQTAAYNMSPVIHFLPDLLRNTTTTVTTFHDLRFPYLFPKAGPLRHWVVNRLARTSAGVVATNQEDLQRLRQHNPNHVLIPIGSNINETLPSDANARAFVAAPPDAMVLAFFGFVNHSKGIDILIESLGALHRAGVTTFLLMVGDRTGSSDTTNAAYSTQIDALIAQHNLNDYVKWTGFVTDTEVRAYLHSADAVVMPFRDGASYRRSSLTSAIAQGCCIVTTTPAIDVPAFQHRDNMLLVPPSDSPALTDALLTLYKNPSLRGVLRHGAKQLHEEFSWDRITSSYVNFFRNLAEAHA